MEAASVVALLAVGATAAIAAVGALRLSRIVHLVHDPRLASLGVFLTAFAATAVIELFGVLLFEIATRDGVLVAQGFDLHDGAFWAGHVMLLVALAFAVRAYHPPNEPDKETRQTHRAPAMATVLLVAEPIVRLVAALALLYLAMRAAWNHAHKGRLGSLRAAGGFLFLLVDQALRSAAADPLGAPDPYAAAAGLLGILLIVGALPRLGRRPTD